MASKSDHDTRRPNTENTTITQQPRRSARNQRVEETDREVAADEAQVSPTPEDDYEFVDELDVYSTARLRAEVIKLRKQLSQKEAEIAYLHQQNQKSLTSDEFHSAHSTPFSSMNTEPSSPVTTGPTGEGSSFSKERDNVKVKGKQTMSARVSELEEKVKQKHKRVVELERRLDQVTNLEPQVERLTMELSKYEQQAASNPDVSNDGYSQSTEPKYVSKLRKEVNELRTLKSRCEEAEKKAKHYEVEYRQEMRKHAELRESLEKKSTHWEGTSGSMESKDSGTKKSRLEDIHNEKQRARDEETTQGVEATLQMDGHEKDKELELQEKEEMIRSLQKKVQELEKAARALGELQRHSKVQSQQVMGLQDKAKASDTERQDMQLSLDKMQEYVSELEEGRMELSKNNGMLKDEIKTLKKEKKEVENALSIIEAKMMAKDLTMDRLERSLSSLQDKLKVTTMENTTLKDRLRKVGFLQEETGRLTAALNERTKELEDVVAERDELKNSLELTQTQVSIYEEDFKTERDDRARAQTQRAEEGERYREEIARLQKELNGHKGNLSGVEQIHIARQKELIKAMEDLKKAQEEIQAKTSQVKQYKKQHDQLVAKMASLESDNQGLMEQFEEVRQKLEKTSKTSTKKLLDGHAEKELKEQLSKQTEMTVKYKRKSKTRKCQIADLASRYTSDMEQLRKDSKSKEKKKSVNKVSISSPVSDMEQHCRVLEYTNESLQDENKALKKINETLRGFLRQSSDTDDDDESSANTKQDVNTWLSSPEEDVKMPVPPAHMKAVESTSRPRSRSAYEKSSSKVTVPTKSVTQMMQATVLSTEHSKPQPEQPQPHPPDVIVKHMNADQPKASNDDPQYADYVNQSRIQAMIDAMHKPLPHSAAVPPEESVPLPPPIVNYPMDEPKMAGLQKGTQQPNFHGYDHNVQPSHMQRSQLSDNNAGAGGMAVEHSPVSSQGGSQHGVWPSRTNTGRVGGRGDGGRGGYGQVGDGRVGQQEGRQGKYFEGRSSPIGKVQRQHEVPSQLSGPASLPSPSSSITPLPRQHSLDNKQRTQSDALAQYQAMQEQQVLRQSNDVLTPGITTEVHAVAQGLMDDHEGGERREVTGVPYDPNLTCVSCGKVFRIGEIQLYRSHNATCAGTVV